jgi:hypothetical protein
MSKMIDAETEIVIAMKEHGTPNWIAYVPSSVRQLVTAERMVELRAEHAETSANIANKTATKNDLIDTWCEQHVLEQVTLEELATIGNCSKSFVRKKTTDRPDIFRRINRSTFQVRDPQADRQAKEVTQ